MKDIKDIRVRLKQDPALKEKQVDGISIRLIMKSGAMEVLLIEMAKGAAFGAWFQHRGEEYQYVLSGEVEFQVENQNHRLKVGDSLWHKSSLSHTAKNVGDQEAVYLSIIVPPSFM